MSDAWDANTELWTKRIRAKSDLSRRFLLDPLLLQIIKSYPHSHMLDAGCGEGTFTLSMANLANAKIDAIDFSYFMCRQAQKLLEASGNHIINADLHHFPFKPSIFDLAVANMVLSGIKDIDNCFKEFTRTLKPQGTLVFSIINPSRVIPNVVIKENEKNQDLPSIIPVENYTKRRNLNASLRLGEQVRLPKSVPYYHRMISDYAKILKDNDFVILEIHEPVANQDLLKSHPHMADFWLLAPFIIFVAQKRC